MYQLVQSAGRDGHGSIAAKSLSGEGYEGHYFWDTEMYVEPFLVLSNPEIARGLISHRYATLEQARQNARILGHKKRLNIKEIPENNFPTLLHYHPLFLCRHQVCKQADTVLARIVFDDAPLKTMINSFLYTVKALSR